MAEKHSVLLRVHIHSPPKPLWYLMETDGDTAPIMADLVQIIFVASFDLNSLRSIKEKAIANFLTLKAHPRFQSLEPREPKPIGESKKHAAQKNNAGKDFGLRSFSKGVYDICIQFVHINDYT